MAAGLAAAALSPIVVTAAVSVLELSIPPDTALKSRYRSNGGEKREGTGDSNNNVPALSRGLFIEGFRKCSSGGNILNTIKGATRLACLFSVVGITVLVVGIAVLVVGIAVSVVGIAVLGSRGELTPRAVRFYKYYNIS